MPPTKPLCPVLILVLPLALALSSTPASASDDWPQWRGPERDGTSSAFEPPAKWPQKLTLSWEVEVGRGDSSPLVAGDRVYVQTREGDNEVLAAFQLTDGKPVWRSAHPAPFKYLSIVGEHQAGPFSTPSFADGRIFTLGIGGVFTAWNAADGSRLWQRDPTGEFKFARPFYGASQSPLVVDGVVYVHLGGPGDGAFAALDAATGKTRWEWKGDGPAYGSPLLVELDGVSQLVTLTQRNLVGLDPSRGELLWQVPFKLSFDLTSLTPVVHDGLVILSGNEVATRAYRPHRENGQWLAPEVWNNDQVSMAFSSPVIADGALLAFSSKNKGQVVALDPATGVLRWSGPPRNGENAWLLVAGDTVVAIFDNGEMRVLDGAAASYQEVASYELAKSPIWAHPALLSRGVLIKDQTQLRLWSVVPD